MKTIPILTAALAHGLALALAPRSRQPQAAPDASRRPFQAAGKNPLVESPAVRAQLHAYTAAIRLGQEAFARGDDATAEARYNEALGIRPELREAYGYLAQIHEREGRAPDALVDYRQLLRESPGYRSSQQRDPQILAHYGELCESAGDVQEARLAYALAARSGIDSLPPAEIRPRGSGFASIKAAAFGRAGTTAAAHGKNQDAIAFFQEARKADPGAWAVWYHLGVTLRYVGQRSRSESALAKAEALAGRDAPFVRDRRHVAPSVRP